MAWMVMVYGFAMPSDAQDTSAPELMNLTEQQDNSAHVIVDTTVFSKSFLRRHYRLELGMTRPTPYKIRYLDNPYRIVFDFDDFDFTGMPADLNGIPAGVSRVSFGASAPEKSRLILQFAAPAIVDEVAIEAGVAGQSLRVDIVGVTPVRFIEVMSAAPFDIQPSVEISEKTVVSGAPQLPLIVIDAGHGGIDSGATRAGIYEKDVTLTVAQELAQALLETGRYRVALTRNEDDFIGLRARRNYAQQVGGDLFISLHANTVEEGDASGTTVYVLSDEASSAGAKRFAAFENRSEHVAGFSTLSEDEDITRVLIDLARNGTDARSKTIASRVQRALASLTLRPDWSRRESASFAVLKAPDVPSILVEIGFLSNDTDRGKMLDPKWRRVLVGQLVLALDRSFPAKKE